MVLDFQSAASIQFTDDLSVILNCMPDHNPDEDCKFGDIHLTGKYAKAGTKFFYTVNDAGELTALKTFHACGPNSIVADRTYVSEEARGQKLGALMTRALMQHATQEDLVLETNDFTDKGWRSLAAHWPGMHQEFPTLRISYDNGETTVSGEKPYSLERGYFGDVSVILE